MIFKSLAAACVCVGLTFVAQAGSLRLSDTGITIDAGNDQTFLFRYPVLTGDKSVAFEPKTVTINGSTATVGYDQGGKVVVEISDDGDIAIEPQTVPGGAKVLLTEMQIPLTFGEGGTWSLDGGEAKAFPIQKTEIPHFLKGHGTTLTLRAANGQGVTMKTPASYSFNELVDNRHWNWEIYNWRVHTPITPDKHRYTYNLSWLSKGDDAAVDRPAPAPGRPRVTAALSEKGVDVTYGPDQQFTLTYPTLHGDEKTKVKASDVALAADKQSATLTFPNGASATLTLSGEARRQLAMTFRDVPNSITSFRIDTLIPFSFAQGGQFGIEDGQWVPFPQDKPEKPHLYQGSAKSITLVHPVGGQLRISVPAFSFQQLTDNRAWNWNIFHWFSKTDLPHDGVQRTYTMTFDAPPGQSHQGADVRVDPFGQTTQSDYDGKVHDLSELKQDVIDEQPYYASFNPPSFDEFGGLPGSGERLGLKRTGFFHVEKITSPSQRWVLVNPAGNVFFQLGVCGIGRRGFTYTKGRESIYAWIPPVGSEYDSARPSEPYWHDTSFSFHLANMIRKYGAPISNEKFADIMIDRVRRLGFNSAGAFSGVDRAVCERESFPYAATIPVSPWSERPFRYIPGVHETWDPFDDTNIRNLDANCAQMIAPRKDDPLLIGYFLVNEPLYQDIPRVVPMLKGDWACKRELVRMLQAKYSDIDAFNTAWQMQANAFDELNDQGLPVRTQAAADDLREYTGYFLETYFKLVHDTVKKYDPNHMLIGNRLQTGTANDEQLCRISGKYLDVFSLNYYTYGFDMVFLNRLHEWMGDKPMLLSEFYWNSPSDSGLPGGVKDIGSQVQRGLAYRHYVEHAANIPYVVGVQWFTLVDASLTGQWFGKYNGENCNSGLFNVADRPWKPMVAEMVKTNYRIYDVHLGKAEPFVFDDPRFTNTGKLDQTIVLPRVAQPLVIDGQADGWPGIPAVQLAASRLVQGNATNVEGSFKMTWDHHNLYLLVEVKDQTPMQNQHSDGDLWKGDGVELFIGWQNSDQGGPLLFTDRQILLSASGRGEYHFVKQPHQPEASVAVTRGADGYTLEAAIPFQSLGFEPRNGQTLRFDLAIDNSDDGHRRDQQLMWNGTAGNSGDRSAWGIARLSE